MGNPRAVGNKGDGCRKREEQGCKRDSWLKALWDLLPQMKAWR